jgi:hypothetical protein
MGEYQSRQAEKHICSLFKLLQNMPSAKVRALDIRPHWAYIKTNKTCLFCCFRTPQHTLSCGHTICDICVQIFGDAVIGAEYKYTINACILCKAVPSAGSLTAKLKPPTCGIRILGIDGGGTRGVIPLEFLLQTQKLLGSCVIQDFFDIVVGTSSGK